MRCEQPAALQLGVRVEEAVGGDQRDVRVLGPVRQHLLQHARGRRLADRDRAGQPDHERRARRLRPVEELLLLPVQPAGALDVQAEQAGQRQVDLLHLVEVERVPEAAQPGDLLLGERALGVERRARPTRRAPARRTARARDRCRRTRAGARRSETWRAFLQPPRSAGLPPRLAAMCGIVGYVGPKQAQDVVVEGLRRLEYRGYDSAGVALVADGAIASAKKAGKLANLEKAIADDAAARVLDRHRAHPLGHARRAQRRQRAPAPRRHRPGRAGAQRDHRELRRAAHRARGRRPRAGLRDRHRGRRPPARARGAGRRRPDHRDAAGLPRLEGAFTLVAVDADDPSRVVAARRNSPLVVGLGEGENFLGSDVAAFIEHTREALELGQDQVVTITREGVTRHRLRRDAVRGTPLPRRLGPLGRREGRPRLVHAQGDLRAAAGGGRLAARPARRAAASCSSTRCASPTRSCATSTRSSSSPAAPRSTPGMVAKYAIEHWTRIPVEVELASRVPLPRPDPDPLHAGGRDQPVRRDRRHAAGDPARPRAAVEGAGDLQHQRLDHPARVRRGDLHPRRARRSGSPRPRAS